MHLKLSDAQGEQQSFNGGVSVDNMSWWFWVKAGIGFTFGAAVTYVALGIVWMWLLTRIPALYFIRALTRF